MKELYLSILDAVHYMPPWGMGVRRKTHWSTTLRPIVAGTLSIPYLCIKVYVYMYTHILGLNVVMPSKLAEMAKHPSIYMAMSVLRGSAGEARVAHSLAFSKGSCSLSSCSNPLPPGTPWFSTLGLNQEKGESQGEETGRLRAFSPLTFSFGFYFFTLKWECIQEFASSRRHKLHLFLCEGRRCCRCYDGTCGGLGASACPPQLRICSPLSRACLVSPHQHLAGFALEVCSSRDDRASASGVWFG